MSKNIIPISLFMFDHTPFPWTLDLDTLSLQNGQISLKPTGAGIGPKNNIMSKKQMPIWLTLTVISSTPTPENNIDTTLIALSLWAHKTPSLENTATAQLPLRTEWEFGK